MDQGSDLNNNAAIFDLAAFKQRMLDDEEIVKKIIASIIDRMPAMIDELKDNVKLGDIENSGRQAHTIKGAAANLNAESLRKSALNIEEAAKSEAMDMIDELMPELEKQWEKLLPILHDACA